MDAWHRDGMAAALRRYVVPSLRRCWDRGHRDSRFQRAETGQCDSRRLACGPQGRRPRFYGAAYHGRWPDYHQWVPRPKRRVSPPVSGQSKRRLPRPRFPAFSDRLRIAVDAVLFQLLDAVLHCFGRLSYFSLADLNNGQRKGRERRLQFKFPSGNSLNFCLLLAGLRRSGSRVQWRFRDPARKRISALDFARTKYSVRSRARPAFLSLVPRLAHGRGDFFDARRNCSRPPEREHRLELRRKRFVPRKIIFVRINHTKESYIAL